MQEAGGLNSESTATLPYAQTHLFCAEAEADAEQQVLDATCRGSPHASVHSWITPIAAAGQAACMLL